MEVSWIESSRDVIAGALVRQLCGRRSGLFRTIGEAATRVYVDAALAALRADLESGKREAIREAVGALVEELTPKGLTFSDLRLFTQGLRTHALGAFEASQGSEAARRLVDDWFFELATISSTRFLARREEDFQTLAAKQEVSRLESQLSELKAAVEEKTQLLEMIRQASTPIAPVVRGILVVPLVGMFDAFRAELLTEKLLREIVRMRAHVVILDITGVPVFDHDAAQLIPRLSHTIRLLGAEMILVGLSPQIARAIVELGVDLAGLRTLGTLQDGLALALRRRRLKIAPI